MTDQLSIYNGALRSVGERKLATLTDKIESRRLLDDVWDDDFYNKLLRQGQWDFAMRTVKMDYNSSYNNEFGPEFGFDRPSDLVRITGLSADEHFSQPMLHYVNDNNIWWTGREVIYVRYVSNDSAYGTDLSLWPPDFLLWAEHWMGLQILKSLSGNKTDYREHKDEVKDLLKTAKNTDAQEKPAKFPDEGSWVRSRRSRTGGERGHPTGGTWYTG